MDDASCQLGTITVDGLTFDSGYGSTTTPLVQISDNNLSGTAATHFRNVTLNRPEKHNNRWPLANLGGGPQVPPVTKEGVPIYLHDHFGPGRHMKIVSTKAQAELADGNQYKPMPPYTGDKALAAEVTDVEFPTLLNPIDDLPPATIITAIRQREGKLEVVGVSHDNGDITRVVVNGTDAETIATTPGVVDWQVTISPPADEMIAAHAVDAAGNEEQTRHRIKLGTSVAALSAK